MTTKVFSSRLKTETVKKIKDLSNKNSESVQETLEMLILKGFEAVEKKQDPWLEFSGSIANADEIEDIINSRKIKNLKNRKFRKSNFIEND